MSEAGKVLISTTWTRTWLIKMETVEMHPVMCGAIGLVLVSTVNLIFLSFFFASSSSWSSDTFGGACGVFYGAGRCWSAARRVSGLEGNVCSLKTCICCHTLAPCLHQPIATTTESANPAAAPRGMTAKDKKIELMVLTSTSHVTHRRLRLERRAQSDSG